MWFSRPVPDDPDLPLVRAAQGGDADAFTSLVRQHQEPLFRFALRYLANEEDAREVAQEAFVRAHGALPRFVPGARFSTWLFQITHNLCRDRARSRATKQARVTASLDLGTFDPPDSAARPDAAAIAREEVDAVEAAIQALPDELKAPLILTALEGLSQQETGTRLRISAKAVETRVYRARQQLRQALERFRR